MRKSEFLSVIIKISNVNMYILCGLKGQCLNHIHVAHVYECMGAECSKLRQPMRKIFALSRAQLLLLVVTGSRDLSRECHVTKHKTPARSNFPLSNFKNSGTIQFSSSSSTSRRLCPKIFERVHPIINNQFFNPRNAYFLITNLYDRLWLSY